MSTRSANPRATWTRPVSVAIGCGVALVVAAACGVAYGTVGIGWSVSLRMVWAAITGGSVSLVYAASYWIVVDSRVPRVLTGALVGAGLAVVGVIVQAMVRNPLADPYVLGISSGASVGATAVVLFGVFSGLGLYALPTAAFLGALVATLLVFGIAQRGGGLTPLRLVLTGTALGYGFSALTTVLIFLRPVGDAARSVMFWLLGSLAAATWHSVALVAVVAVFFAFGFRPGRDTGCALLAAMRPDPRLLRTILRVGLPAFALAMVVGLYLSDETRRAEISGGVTAMVEKVQTRDEFMVHAMKIEGASPVVDKGLRAMLPVTLPASSFDIDLPELRASVERLDAIEKMELRIKPGGVLSAVVTERTPAMLWRHARGIELLDKTGHRVASATSRDVRPDLPMIAIDSASYVVRAGPRLVDGVEALAWAAGREDY